MTRADLIAWVKANASRTRTMAATQWHGSVEGRQARAMADKFDAIAALLEAGDWQNIATAPKDGTPMLGYTPHESVVVGDVYWSTVMEEWQRLPLADRVRPTHWMPLPAPPTTEAV